MHTIPSGALADEHGKQYVVTDSGTRRLFMAKLTNPINSVTLAVPAILGSRSFTLSPGHGVVVGNIINLIDTISGNGFQSFVTSVVGDVITTALPLDYAFPTSSIGQRATDNLAVNGSVTPVIFELAAFIKSWTVTSMHILMSDDTKMDVSTFAGIATLANGLVFRRKTNSNYQNWFAIRNNGGFELYCDNTNFDAKAAAGLYALAVAKDFAVSNGDGVALDSATSDSIQAIVQDDLTAVTNIQITVMGHEHSEII